MKDKEQDEKQRRDLKGMFERKWKSDEKEEGEEKKNENKDDKYTSTAAGSSKTSLEPRFVELED
jgi:hypothetical protein